jgi:hypothetical protein
VEYLKPKRRRIVTTAAAKEKKEEKKEVTPLTSTISSILSGVVSGGNEELKSISRAREALRKEAETKRQTPVPAIEMKEMKEREEKKNDKYILFDEEAAMRSYLKNPRFKSADIMRYALTRQINMPPLEAGKNKHVKDDYIEAIIKDTRNKNMELPELARDMYKPRVQARSPVSLAEVDDDR